MLCCFSGSEVDVVHCIVDRNLITGQNSQSTVVAVQNVILACSLQYDCICCLALVLLSFSTKTAKKFVTNDRVRTDPGKVWKSLEFKL